MHFDCGSCAAAPRLQKLNGCHEPIPQVVATYGGFDFNSCPRNAFGIDESEVYSMFCEGYTDKLNSTQVRRLPAKLIDSLRYIGALKREKIDG